MFIYKFSCIVNMKLQKLDCYTCNKKSAVLLWTEKYSGFRGICKRCGNNWPES